MENERVIKLIKEFEAASSATGDLMESMDGFRDVLKQYYESYHEIQVIKDEIIEKGIIRRISDSTSELNIMNKQIADNVRTVSESINHIQLNNSEGLTKIIQIDSELKGALEVFNRIDNAVKQIENLNERVQKSMVNEFDVKFEKMSRAFYHIENVIQGFDSTLSTKLVTLEQMINKNHNQVEEHIERSGRVLDQTWISIGEASKAFNNSNGELSNDIRKMTEANSQLKLMLDKISSQNEDGVEAFCTMADEWAARSIHGMAIKKKTK